MIDVWHGILYDTRKHYTLQLGTRHIETPLGQMRAHWEGVSVPALILIIQQHTSDNAAQMPELQNAGAQWASVNCC